MQQQLILGNLLRLPLLFFVHGHDDERTSVDTVWHIRMKEVQIILKEHQSGCCDAIRDAELESRLTAISAPTLVVAGADALRLPSTRRSSYATRSPTPAS